MYLRIHYGSCTRFAAAVEIRAHNVDVVPGSSAPLPQRGFANDLLHGGCGVRGDLEEEAGTALDCTSLMRRPDARESFGLSCSAKHLQLCPATEAPGSFA